MKVGLKKTRPRLPDGEICTILQSLVFAQYRHVTDRQTDGQTHQICLCRTLAQLSATKTNPRVILHQNKILIKSNKATVTAICYPRCIF